MKQYLQIKNKNKKTDKISVSFRAPSFCIDMDLRSSGRKFSFDILTKANSFDDADGSNSDPTRAKSEDVTFQMSKTRKRKKHRKKKPATPRSDFAVVPEEPVDRHHAAVAAVSSDSPLEKTIELDCQSYVTSGTGTTVCTVTATENVYNNKAELRQRNFNGSEEMEETSTSPPEPQPQRLSDVNGGVVVTKLETAESLDWKRLLADRDSNCE